MEQYLQPATFLYLSQKMTGRAASVSTLPEKRRFRSLFGVSPELCSVIWSRLGGKQVKSGNPMHLLWALLFLKVYANEDVLSVIAGVSRKTYRKWVWVVVTLLSNLDEVC